MEEKSGISVDPLLQTALDTWDAADRVLEVLARQSGADESTGALEVSLLAMQSEIMEVVSSVTAKSAADAALKVALWRRDAPEFQLGSPETARSDRVLYSAYRDLIALTGLEKLLTEADKSSTARNCKFSAETSHS